MSNILTHPRLPRPLSAPAQKRAALALMEVRKAERALCQLLQDGYSEVTADRFSKAMAAANGQAAMLHRVITDGIPVPPPPAPSGEGAA